MTQAFKWVLLSGQCYFRIASVKDSGYTMISKKAFNFVITNKETTNTAPFVPLNRTVCIEQFVVIKRSKRKDTAFAQLNAPGVYFELGIADPAFI